MAQISKIVYINHKNNIVQFTSYIVIAWKERLLYGHAMNITNYNIIYENIKKVSKVLV